MAYTSNDRLMTVSEVADCLRVSVPTIWRWLRQGSIMGIKIGKSRRIRWSEVVRFETGGAHQIREVQPTYGSPQDDAHRLSMVAELRRRLQATESPDYPGSSALLEIRRERADKLWNKQDQE
ncbi:MAG: helix-turn-helix domain-containing protein [Clostridia bacterium]|nr:helix-turn-helix domain-containing protein [Clostridia bacterium]